LLFGHLADCFGVGYIADSALRTGRDGEQVGEEPIHFLCWRNSARNRSMKIVNRIWYTFIGLLLVSVFLAMFGADLAKGFFLLWPSIFAASIVGVIVGGEARFRQAWLAAFSWDRLFGLCRQLWTPTILTQRGAIS
jgi:hypothetical protein